MSLWRIITIATLLVVPVMVFVAAGAYALWERGAMGGLWWILPLCWALAWLLAKRWERHFAPVTLPDVEAPAYWTEQDRKALRLVEAQQQAVQKTPPAQLLDPHFYLQTAVDLSLRLARHYHPRSKDPLSSLTIPEILAVAHLAFEDLEDWSRKYVPGSHLLTVEHWRMLSKAPGWFRTVSNVSWAVSILLYPANIGRYLTSRLAVNSARRQIQNNVLAWFYVFFVRYVGFYVIEMNSGRLRGGADRYRRIVAQLGAERAVDEALLGDTPDAGEAAPASALNPGEKITVQVAVVGQVKAGKSSVINALLSEQLAATDVVPLTKAVQGYSLRIAREGDSEDILQLLDTAGYADDAQAAAAHRDMQQAVRRADLVLLVMDVTSPARQADRLFLEGLARWFGDQPQLKRVKIVGVLTHIDGLRPFMEWNPPYDFIEPRSPKEQSIQDAVAYNRSLLGDHLAAIVPVCCDTDRGRVFGVQEWLVPAMTALMDDAKACSLVRTLHTEAAEKRVSDTLAQLRRMGLILLNAYLDELKK